MYSDKSNERTSVVNVKEPEISFVEDPNYENMNYEAQASSKLLNFLISIEGIYSPDPNFLETTQPDISSHMRAILLDWMMEV